MAYTKKRLKRVNDILNVMMRSAKKLPRGHSYRIRTAKFYRHGKKMFSKS